MEGTGWDTRWRSCLEHCPTIRKVAGSIPDGVIVIFHWHHPSGRTMDLGSTLAGLPGIFPGGKGGRCVELTTLPASWAPCYEIWDPQPPGTLRACPDVYWDCFTFTLYRGNKGRAPLILNRNRNVGWAVNITNMPIYLQERNPVPTEQETQEGPESVWSFVEDKHFFHLQGIRTPDRPTRSAVTIPTELCRLPSCLTFWRRIFFKF